MGKYIVQSTTTERFDKATGEMLEQTTSTSVVKKTTEPFFYTFSKEVMALYGKTIFNATTQVLWKLLEFAEYNTGKVYMNKDRVEQILTECKISKRSYYRAMEELRETGIISGTNSTIQIAENMFWKGDKQTRDQIKKAKLRVTFEPVIVDDGDKVTAISKKIIK